MKRFIVFGMVIALAISGAVLSLKAKKADAAPPTATSEAAPPTVTSEKDFGYTIQMLSTNENNMIEGTEGISVHFKARHKVFVTGPYQFVVRARTYAWDVVAEHFFDRYEGANSEERHDEFSTTLDVPPGEYQVEVELISLYPVQDIDGNKIADHLGQGNYVYRATSRLAAN